jgi:hypothetical protein
MLKNTITVGVAQTAEHRVVAPAVAGSSPVAHPNYYKDLAKYAGPFLFNSPQYSPHGRPF